MMKLDIDRWGTREKLRGKYIGFKVLFLKQAGKVAIVQLYWKFFFFFGGGGGGGGGGGNLIYYESYWSLYLVIILEAHNICSLYHTPNLWMCLAEIWH